MKCPICDCEILKNCPDCEDKRVCSGHHQQGPVMGICLGCLQFRNALEKFMYQKTKRNIIGNWTEGWMRSIIKDPTFFMNGPTPQPGSDYVMKLIQDHLERNGSAS